MSERLEKIAEVWRLIDREVWIVTAAHAGRRGGLAATWVSQSSIDPARPRVAAGLAPNHFTAELVAGSGYFVAHLLAADRPEQVEQVWNFALGSGRHTDKFQGLEFDLSAHGTPRLRHCLAWIECRVVQRHDGGDRLYFWADVLETQINAPGPALREKQLIATATAERRQLLLENIRNDIEVQRPLAPE